MNNKAIKLLVLLLSIFNVNLVIAEEITEGADKAQKPIGVNACVLCHPVQYNGIKSSSHWMTGDERAPAKAHECASCHGNLEEHVLSSGASKGGEMKTFKKTTKLLPEEQNAVCVACHKDSKLLNWVGSGHDNGDIGCVGCHQIHSEDKVRARVEEKGVCYTCHTDMRAQEHKPYGHPLSEGKMACSDCHNPHGGPGDADLKTFTINETCTSCHAEKRGPFLWEHIPVSEDCTLCHSQHGSINQGMLTRRQPHLCQSCHEAVGPPNQPNGPHQRHSRLTLSYRDPGQIDIGPDGAPPAFKGISRFGMGEACGNCHSMVHGSNHPAGSKLTR